MVLLFSKMIKTLISIAIILKRWLMSALSLNIANYYRNVTEAKKCKTSKTEAKIFKKEFISVTELFYQRFHHMNTKVISDVFS